ncbi:TonB-dependent receptor [Opitutaceae bacterium EW11]|nr:TonB-dependent receptor [Opitutaceae bacterium EW11]
MNPKQIKPASDGSWKLPGTLALAALVAWTPVLPAQTAPQPPADKTDQTDTEELITLSPFEVNSSKDNGYAASSSLAGSRLNTELRDVAAAVQAITPEFMKDIGATNLQKLLVYTTNTEIAGIGGNFYGGNAYDKGYSRGMLMEPQRTTRIRGLNDADITRDYFPSDVPMDWYNLSRVDISRGPNSILFGLGSPAGLVNNTLKVANLRKSAGSVELTVGRYGSVREMVDIDQMILPGTLGIRVVGLNDEAKFRQDFTFNHDKRIYVASRWEPKLSEHIFTQVDVQVESGRINANRPVSQTPSDFLSNWFGPANRLAIPNDEYWTTPGFVEDLYASQTIGGQLWDDHPVSFFSEANNPAVGLPGGNTTQAMLLRGAHNVNGGGWGSWVGMLNPNSIGLAAHPKNSKEYFANNPTVAAIISDYESKTGKTFRGFGQGMWPTQMMVSGPLADMMFDQNLIGPNKSEHNYFDNVNVSFTQSYFDGRLGINGAYNRQSYRTGYSNLMEGLWGNNMISVDVNQTMRGSTTPNPNYGRPFTIGEGRGGVFERDRENWRVTGFGVVKATDFFKRDNWFTDIVGEHTFTGVKSAQRYHNFDRYYALYRWTPDYLQTVDKWNGYATWRGLHYLGGSILNTPTINDVSLTGVRTIQTPPLTQNVWYDNQGTWMQSQFNLITSDKDIDKLYDGANEGYDDTSSKVFVWQGKMLKNVIVPIFGWRQDEYTRWNKPSTTIKDPTYGYVLPFSPDWNYDKVTPIYAKEQRRSWSIAVHGKELMELFGRPLPKGMDITLLYNKSSSFRPSDVSVSVYNKQEPNPSGETKDYSLLVSAFNDRVSLRITRYKTVQHNTPYSGPQPDFGWAKANIGRSMDGMMWEIGPWAGNDPTKRVQPTPEWLVNRWMFGDNYDKTIASQPLPTNWRSDPNIMNQPLRIRRSAVPGSPTYVAEGTIDPDQNRPYIAPPLDAEEIEYRTEWYKARTDAQWSRPVDQQFWSAMGFARDYSAQWGGFWELNAWQRPQNLRSLNDLESKGTEYELTANPTPNWRITLNASKAEAVRSNVLTSWDEFIANNKEFFFDGGYGVGDTPASNYWNFKGYYDIPQTPGNPLDPNGRLGTNFNNTVYNPYYQAKATADQAVNELRKWHWNAITNYKFTRGFMKNVGIGGAVRWEDKPTLGYYPMFNANANSWVIDLSKPIRGSTEIHYDAWISYERKLTRKINWSVQLNVYDMFAKKELIPIQANPDGTIAQVRVPSLMSWSLRNTFSF